MLRSIALCTTLIAAVPATAAEIIITGGLTHETAQSELVPRQVTIGVPAHNFHHIMLDHVVLDEITVYDSVAKRKHYGNTQDISIKLDNGLIAGIQMNDTRTALIGYNKDVVEYGPFKAGFQAHITNYDVKDITLAVDSNDYALGGHLTATLGPLYATFVPGKKGTVGLRVGL